MSSNALLLSWFSTYASTIYASSSGPHIENMIFLYFMIRYATEYVHDIIAVASVWRIHVHQGEQGFGEEGVVHSHTSAPVEKVGSSLRRAARGTTRTTVAGTHHSSDHHHKN